MSKLETMVVIILLAFVMIRIQLASLDMWMTTNGEFHAELSIAYNSKVGVGD